MEKTLIHLDPSLYSDNAGDEIVRESVEAALGREHTFLRLPTHRRPSLKELKVAANAPIVVVGGTNLIRSHLERSRQWLVTPDLAAIYAKKVVFLGVGWWQYQSPPCLYTRFVLRHLSHPQALHSVRDEYTEWRFRKIGLNATYTNCPTTWMVRPVPGRSRAGEAVITITDYRRNPDDDQRWIRSVAGAYSSVFLVAMSLPDIEYGGTLAIPDNVSRKHYGLAALDELLNSERDYIGTRLHAGIRALQRGRNALILAVDNRAREMSKGSGLPVVGRENPEELAKWLSCDWPEQVLTLPRANIDLWRDSWARLTEMVGRSA